jgi:hypothetical protein
MSKRPPTTTFDEVRRNIVEWKRYREAIGSLVDRAEQADADTQFEDETCMYAGETLAERCARAKKEKEWVWESVDCSHRRTVHDVECLDALCWYRRNDDRIDEYTGYFRLLGTRDIVMCSVCHDLDYPPCDEIERLYVPSRKPPLEQIAEEDEDDDDDDDDDDE